jgi:flagellar motor component MotA
MDEAEFMAEYNALFERALIFSMLSRSMGLVSLRDSPDKARCTQRDIFEYGMRLVVDGRSSELIEKVLANVVNLETDNEKKLLKIIQKDAVLSIQHHIPPEELMMILNSYVNIELDAAWEKYNAIDDAISKVITDQFHRFSDRQTEIYKDISEKIVSLFKERSFPSDG